MKFCFLFAQLCVLCLILTVPAKAFANDLYLSEALVITSLNNAQLSSLRAELQATGEGIAVAKSGFRPDISANLEKGFAQQRTDNPFLSSQRQNLFPLNASITIDQPLFKGFRTQAEILAAEQAVSIGRAHLQEQEQNILFDVCEAYYAIIKLENMLHLIHDMQASARAQKDQIQERIKLGVLRKIDLYQIENKIKDISISSLQTEADLEAQRARFLQLTGLSLENLKDTDFVFDLPPGQEEALAHALKNNPSLKLAEYEIKASEEKTRIARSALYPSINLIGTALHSEDPSERSFDKQDSLQVSLRLNMPLYRTGADYAKIRAAKNIETQKNLEFENTRRKIKEEVQRTWKAFRIAQKIIADRKDFISTYNDTLEDIKTELKIGSKTTLDLFNAEQNMYEAQKNLLLAIYEEKIAAANLKKAMGELTIEALDLPLHAYGPSRQDRNAKNTWIGFSMNKEKMP